MWALILENLSQITLIEAVAVGSLTAYVILASRQLPLCWPVSMLGVSLYFLISYQAGLYAEMPLQVFYFVISIYGFYHWKYGGADDKKLEVSKLKIKPGLWLLLLAALGTIMAGLALERWTDSTVAWWDAGTTVCSIIATWMQARKKLENWLVWIGVDLVYVGLFYYKGYILLSGLNVFYIIIAIYGFLAWRNSMKKYRLLHEKDSDNWA